MTKRFGNFQPENIKKPKLDNDIDALWGEDLDENALEECIKLATQVCEEEKITCTQLNNVTVLPTYNAFKERSAIITSTQFNNSIRPSTSKFEFVSKKETVSRDLEKEVKLLRQQCEEREGEVAILRTRLQETKVSVQIEQQKTQNEWKQKLTVTERQMKSVKSELEFKNLEIANLKRKILDITKRNNLDTTLNATQPTPQKIKKDRSNNKNTEVKLKPSRIQAILDPVYPLKGFKPDAIFNTSKREHCIIETKLMHTCRNAIPYLQNQMTSAIVAMDKSHINIDSVYPDILKLVSSTEKEINLDENIAAINKILCTCEQFLDDLQTFLDQIKSNLKTEDVLEADTNYLKHQDSEFLCKEEIGQKSSILLNLLAELMPYSNYLQNYICQDKHLSLHEMKHNVKKSDLTDEMNDVRQHNFLNMLLNIIKIAGEIRKANSMTNFFCSVVNLLINIGKTRHYDHVSDIFCELTKELVLSRPTAEVICQITFLFKVVSAHSSFIEFLFNKSQNSMSSKKGILYFNEDGCRFYVFVMLFNNSIFQLESEHFSLSICLNMLCFMYNTFKTSHWIHHRDTKECECVPQLYKLQIEIVFRALEKYVEEINTTGRRSSDWNHFFKDSIAVQVLNLMTFNSYELTERYITVFSQYKEIEKRLQEADDLNELEKLNISEEIVEVPSDAFASVKY